jgi:hypothetical protein
MPRFYVNTNPQPNGDHEVHEEGSCLYPPYLANRKDLGYYANCAGAVKEAKKTYSKANGCYYCCRPCHTS